MDSRLGSEFRTFQRFAQPSVRRLELSGVSCLVLRLVSRLVVALIAALVLHAGVKIASVSAKSASDDLSSQMVSGEMLSLQDTSYAEVLDGYAGQGMINTRDVSIQIPAGSYVASEGELGAASSIGGRTGRFLLWTQEDSWVEWEVNIPQSGLYNIAVEYFPLPGKRASIQTEIKIDGSYPFSEAKRIFFERTWRDAYKPVRDNQGNDVRPRQVEVPLWRVKSLEDPDGMFKEPLLFYLSKGVHKIRMTSIREPLALSYIRVHSPDSVPSYREVVAVYKQHGYTGTRNAMVKIQAEDVLDKTDPTVRREYGTDAISEPTSGDKLRLNEFGGWRWRKAGQEVSWEFEVPEDGLYTIGMRVAQSNHLPVIRSVQIDGNYPFTEMQEVRFPHSRSWELRVLSGRTAGGGGWDNRASGGDFSVGRGGYPRDGQNTAPASASEGERYTGRNTSGVDNHGDEPWQFYLTKGRHTLTMRVKVGPVARTVRTLMDASVKMAEISRQIVMITGTVPDPNMEWEIEKQIPDLLPRLSKLADGLEGEIGFLTELAGRKPGVAYSIEMIADQMRNMVKRPETIPLRLEAFASSQSALGAWVLALQEQPLLMDYLLVMSPGSNLPRAQSTFWERLGLGVRNFLASFRKDYTGLGNVYQEPDSANPAGGAKHQRVLTVWVARGREWAEIIKELAEEDFTPDTGINVNMNIVPAGQLQALILAMVAGKGPDIVLGVDSNLPVEFAIRNALVDLKGFPDYPEVAKRFRPGSLIPFAYKGGAYAFPENQDFTMLFYRKDILQRMGLNRPQTWEDVYALLPVLAQNGLEFYYPQGLLTPFLFQHGGDYYTNDGLRSALDAPEALAAFTEWTGLYTDYKIPAQANFYNRMRTGEMPVGVANYWQYVLLSTAAPEITGWWAMTPMPGTKRADGVIDRSIGGASQTVIITRQAKDKQDAWKFLKWWTSTPIQSRFGTELEALLGVEARWNTANVEALKNLPWPKKDLYAILEQWEWFKEQPVVLGGYFTGRHIANAWNRVVLQGSNPREALEDAVRDINRELKKKQEEFGVTEPDTRASGGR